ncbi:MAG: ABC transporter permease [Clostridiales bacterium]|nr:ABC transporter permease [Clostridiales bacterium]
MRSLTLMSRNAKELVRDPLTAIFCVGFPLVVLLLLSAIQANIPVELFAIENLAPGIAVFGLSFLALFAGFLLAKDRTTSFLMRLFASPLTAGDYLLGYAVPLLFVAVAQGIICYGMSLILGLPMSANLLLGLVVLIPPALLFIAMGLLLGSLVSDKAVGGIASVLVNVAAWLGNIWFDPALVGGVFRDICYLLPFAHAADAGRAALSGNYGDILPHLCWVLGYGIIIFAAAILVFRRKMKSGKG